MDYKSVIEEQIRELQKVQDGLVKVTSGINAGESCRVAETIARLCDQARYIPTKKEEPTEVDSLYGTHDPNANSGKAKQVHVSEYPKSNSGRVLNP
jgi:hypothetical protein